MAIIFLLYKTSTSYASTIFQESMSGISGSNWSPADLNFIGSSPAVYNNQGVVGTSNAGQGYINTSISSSDIIVKWTMNLNGISTGFVDCRLSSDGQYEQRAGFNGGGIAIDAWPNGGTSYIPLESSGNHSFELDCIGNTIKLKEDGNIIRSSTSGWDGTSGTGEQNTNFRIGISDTTTTYTSLYICDGNGCSTPTPTPIQLSVTALKQNSGGWQNLTYDLANIWSPLHQTISTWGCALTSAAMVLNYYNIHTIPNSVLPLNPGNLDAWLGTQPDGYIPNGNVNWLALQRLTKQAKANNPNFPFDALEYSRSNFADTTTLLADLQNNQPDILEEPGHFVVATGRDSNNIFTIDDPFFDNRPTLASYGNTFSSLGRYVPSFTNLSYILFTNDPSLTLSLKDTGNNPVGTSYTQQPLSGDDVSFSAGNPINILSLQNPTSGNYTLTISGNSNQTYLIKGFLYDVNGNVKPFSQTGVVDPNNQNTVTLHFDSQNLSNDSSVKIVTIGTFLSDLSDLYALKLLKTAAYLSLKTLGENTQKHMQKHNTLAVKIDLGLITGLLKTGKGPLISDSAYQILSADIQYLQAHQ